MSEVLPQFKLLQPKTLTDASVLLRENQGARLCAGGTDLVVNMRHGLIETETLIDLSGLPELQGITQEAGELRIGAGVTLREVAENTSLEKQNTAVHEAALAIAGATHREVATVGGNLCLDTRCTYFNQSHWWRKSNDFCLKYRGTICHVAPNGNRCRAAFCGDLAPALMALNAEVEIAGEGGLRRKRLGEFYNEDGAAHLSLEPDEILVAVYIPENDALSAYGKIRIRGAIDFPLAGVAVAYCKGDCDGHKLQVALTGTNSRPFLLEIPDDLSFEVDREAALSELSKLVQKAVSPQRTTTMAPHYRRLSVSALAVRIARKCTAP